MANQTSPRPRTYTEAAAVLGTRNTRRIANNTTLHRRADGAIAVRLHTTDVVAWFDDGRVTFDTGGWNTSTTARRMHRYAPPGVRVTYRPSLGGVYLTDTRTGSDPTPALIT